MKPKCNQCEPMVINGLFCHETGCPNSRKKWNGEEWVSMVKCFECGFEVEEGTECDCQRFEEMADHSDEEFFYIPSKG